MYPYAAMVSFTGWITENKLAWDRILVHLQWVVFVLKYNILSLISIIHVEKIIESVFHKYFLIHYFVLFLEGGGVWNCCINNLFNILFIEVNNLNIPYLFPCMTSGFHTSLLGKRASVRPPNCAASQARRGSVHVICSHASTDSTRSSYRR